MTYSEQFKWLTDNGFIDIPTSQQNMIFWEKELSGDRILQFMWHNRVPDWTLMIFGSKDNRFDSDVWLVDSIPSDADFTQFQPLIDIIK